MALWYSAEELCYILGFGVMLILLIGYTNSHVNSFRILFLHIVVNGLIGYTLKGASLAYYGIDN